MINTKKRFLLILLSAVILLSACGSGSDTETNAAAEGKTYEFKMTHVTQSGHIWHKFSEKFAEELEAKSNGRMTMEIFPAAQLGPEADMVQQLSSGSLDFALLTVPYLSTRIPEFDAWNMPFLFEDLEASLAAQDTDPAQKMLGLLDEQGIIGLDYFNTANHNLLVSGKPIQSIEDLDGKKIRFTGGESVIDFWEGLGASPIAMGLPEVYNALQTGIVEGVSLDHNPVLSEKIHEVGEHYVMTNHMAFGGVVTASKANLEAMPEEDQKIINDALAAAVEWGESEIVKIEESNMKELDKVVNVVELENRDEFVKEAEKVHEEYAAKNELIKEFIDAVKKE